MTQSAPRRALVDDFWAIPERQRFHELIDGELTQKSAPTGEHGDAQAGVVSAVRPLFQRKSSVGGPGGWWILTEVEVLLSGDEIVRPDVLGWLRARCPERPTGTPVRVRPDWVCEVVSPSNANDDTVKKLRLYHRNEIPHYWVVDPRDATLTVLRFSHAGYVTLLRAERHETIHPEPFEAIGLFVGSLFGDDPL
ncbi:MAG: Uma2 family endonuclease [Planctomycetota bacterium]|nr:Uma2 family endonuclease [Planctomycetota bacterium]